MITKACADLRPGYSTPPTCASSYLPVDPVSRTTYQPGELAQCDLWFPDAQIPLGYGQTDRTPVLVMMSGYSRCSVSAAGRGVVSAGCLWQRHGCWPLLPLPTGGFALVEERLPRLLHCVRGHKPVPAVPSRADLRDEVGSGEARQDLADSALGPSG